MGYPEEEFEHPDRISQVLKCQICMEVLENPQIVIVCEHIFCDHCIHDWLDRKLKCPVCRVPISIDRERDVRAAPLMIRQLISDLSMKCQNCDTVLPVDQMLNHKKTCKADPFAPSTSSSREVQQLKTKVLCLEGQLKAKTQENKNLVDQRNTLADQLEEAKKSANTSAPISRPIQRTMDDHHAMQTDSPEQKVITKIEYVQDPGLLDKCVFLERSLQTLKNKHTRDLDTMRDEMRQKEQRDARKIEDLQVQVEEGELSAFNQFQASAPPNPFIQSVNSEVSDAMNTTEPRQTETSTAINENGESGSRDEEILQLQILLTTFQDEKDHYMNKWKLMQKQLQEAQRSADDQRDAVVRATNNVKKYEEQRDEVFNDLLNAQREKSAANAEKQVVLRQLNEEKSKINELNKKHRSEIQSLKWQIDDLEMSIENYKMEINRLKSTINRLENENEGLRKSVNRRNRED